MENNLTYNELEERLKELESELDLQKKIKQKLEKKRYYLEQAQEIGGMGTWEVDLTNNHLHWTPQMYEMFGVPMQKGIKLDEVLRDLLHHDDQQLLNKAWEGALEGKPYDFEHRAMVNGKIRWFREKSKLIYDEKGTMISAIGITQDITYRIDTER